LATLNFWSDDGSADLRKAGELVRSVLAKDNLSPQVKRLAHWLFAWVLPSEHDFGRALNEADTAIALAPYDAFVLTNLAQIAIISGKLDKGLEWTNFAREHDPNGLKQQNYNKGLALRLLGKYDDSIAAFRQSFYPDGDAPLHLAVALVRLGSIDEAKAEVKLMLKKNDPKFTQAKWKEGWFYSDPSIQDAEVADLGRAGLPEK
jgi:tetratricopeptide (TPR) repeat protein